MKKILAVASRGGHWQQLLRLKPAFDGHRVTYVSSDIEYKGDVSPAPFYYAPDANRWSKVSLVKLAIRILYIYIYVRPHIVITTGAAPGYFAIMAGKILGARTIWLDSIANAEELSMSGKKAGRFADLWLTQWEHLSSENGPVYAGAVI